MDIITVEHTNCLSFWKIDEIFIDVCEDWSLNVISALPVEPTIYGVGMHGKDKFFIKTKEPIDTQFTVMISGVRKGFAGRRFADRTKADYDKNMKFWTNI